MGGLHVSYWREKCLSVKLTVGGGSGRFGNAYHPSCCAVAQCFFPGGACVRGLATCPCAWDGFVRSGGSPLKCGSRLCTVLLGIYASVIWPRLALSNRYCENSLPGACEYAPRERGKRASFWRVGSCVYTLLLFLQACVVLLCYLRDGLTCPSIVSSSSTVSSRAGMVESSVGAFTKNHEAAYGPKKRGQSSGRGGQGVKEVVLPCRGHFTNKQSNCDT